MLWFTRSKALLRSYNEVLLQYGVRVKIFADDVKVYVAISHDSTVNELQTVLDVLYAWATEWQLQVSVEKCAILKISNVSDNNDYYIKNLQLPNVMSCRDLGYHCNK